MNYCINMAMMWRTTGDAANCVRKYNKTDGFLISFVANTLLVGKRVIVRLSDFIRFLVVHAIDEVMIQRSSF